MTLGPDELLAAALEVVALDAVTMTVKVVDAVAAVTVVVASVPARSARGRSVALFQMKVFVASEQQEPTLVLVWQHAKSPQADI